MNILKNPVVAVLLSLLIVVGATLLNTHLKLGALCREMTDDFYAEDGIAVQLESIRVDAMTLVAVAEENGLEATALSSTVRTLQESLSQRSVGSIYQEYDALRAEVTGMEQKLLSKELSESDAETISACLARIHTGQVVISTSDYNSTVRDFLRQNDRFPTHLLAKLAGVSFPELFA